MHRKRACLDLQTFILFKSLNALIKQDNVQCGRWEKGEIEIIEKSSILNTRGFHWKTQERHSTTWGMWWAALMTPGEPATRGLKQNLHNSMAKFDIKMKRKRLRGHLYQRQIPMVIFKIKHDEKNALNGHKMPSRLFYSSHWGQSPLKSLTIGAGKWNT